MKFYLSLTDENGVVIDRFRLELPFNENPADDLVSEDSEAVGTRLSEEDLCGRLQRRMRYALRTK